MQKKLINKNRSPAVYVAAFLEGVFQLTCGSFLPLDVSFFWKPAAAKTKHLFIFGMCKERSRIFAVLAGPSKVVSKIGKRCGVVLDSRSLH